MTSCFYGCSLVTADICHFWRKRNVIALDGFNIPSHDSSAFLTLGRPDPISRPLFRLRPPSTQVLNIKMAKWGQWPQMINMHQPKRNRFYFTVVKLPFRFAHETKNVPFYGGYCTAATHSASPTCTCIMALVTTSTSFEGSIGNVSTAGRCDELSRSQTP